MKKRGFPQLLPWLILASGIAGAILQYLLFTFATDEKGLLIPGFWADSGSWILSALVMLCLLLGIRPLNGGLPLNVLFPRSLIAGLGNWIGAAGIGYACISLFGGSKLELAAAIAGIAAAVVLLIAGLCRMKGRSMSVFLRFVPILFFVLDLICCYRRWVASTQLQEYAFALFASVFLMLANYQRGALEAGSAGRKRYTFFGLAAAFFCILSGYRHGLFYLAEGIWMLTDHCSLAPVVKPGPKYLQRNQEE